VGTEEQVLSYICGD